MRGARSRIAGPRPAGRRVIAVPLGKAATGRCPQDQDTEHRSNFVVGSIANARTTNPGTEPVIKARPPGSEDQGLLCRVLRARRKRTN